MKYPLVCGALSALCLFAVSPVFCETISPKASAFIGEPLVKQRYSADPSAHVFEGKLYIYPSHDIETDKAPDNDGAHFDMKDYVVYSLEEVGSSVKDMGVALDINTVPWADRQMWAPDAAFKNGKYYLYFPARDKQGVFRIGAAVGDKPMGPFKAEPLPIPGSFSIDPSVFADDDGQYYMFFGGIWGGQLQRWQTGIYVDKDVYPADTQPALVPKIAKMSDNMLAFAEAPKDVMILDEQGKPLVASDNARRFFEAAWVHKYQGIYYLSYSTGDTHFIQYATSKTIYGPYHYKGKVLEPVLGWTNHHSIVEFKGKWYLFYHDSEMSKGQTHLRNIKMVELQHLPDGSIKTIDAYLAD
jgi:beta-xylosidase